MESGIVKNFESLCRLCLVSGVELADIYQPSHTITRFGDTTPFVHKLITVTNLQVREDDELPHVVCKTCSLKVTRSYEFRLQAKRSDEILRRYLQSKKFKQHHQLLQLVKDEKYDDDEANNCQFINNDDNAGDGTLSNNDQLQFATRVLPSKIDEYYAKLGRSPSWRINRRIMDNYSSSYNDTIMMNIAAAGCNNGGGSSEMFVKTEHDDEDERDSGSIVMTVDPAHSLMLTTTLDDNPDEIANYGNVNEQMEDDFDVDEQAEVIDGNFQAIWMGNGGDDDNEQTEITSSTSTSIVASGKVGEHQQQQLENNSNKWTCEYCNSKFHTEEKFNRHSLIHTPEPPFPCDYCEETFELRTDLKSHWRVHSDGNPHVCQMCGKSFPDRMSYLKHSDLHDQVKPFRCPVCQKSFCYGSDLRKHAITHTGVRPYVCSVCGNSFTRSTSLNKHMRMHNGNRPFSCSQCPKIFGSRGDLKRHQIIHSGIKPWICTVCSVPFNRKDKLVRHERLHSGEPRPFQCYECPTSFSRKEDLTKHIQFHHYKPPDSIAQHKMDNRASTTIANGTVVVETDAFEKINSLDLERGNKAFKMLIRETFSGTPGNTWAGAPPLEPPNQQQQYTNTSSSNNKCDICHKNFSQKALLEAHKKLHSAVKPFSCSMCDKSFYRRRELTRHEAVHTGYKPFSCGVCGKCFSRTDKLNRHVQTHEYKNTMNRNFTCDVCSLNFRTIQELDAHRSFCCSEMTETPTNTVLDYMIEEEDVEDEAEVGDENERRTTEQKTAFDRANYHPEVPVRSSRDAAPSSDQLLMARTAYNGATLTFEPIPRMPTLTIQSMSTTASSEARLTNFGTSTAAVVPRDTLNKLENNPEILLFPIA